MAACPHGKKWCRPCERAGLTTHPHPRPKPATQAQLDLIELLARQQHIRPPFAVDRWEASQIITRLKDAPTRRSC